MITATIIILIIIIILILGVEDARPEFFYQVGVTPSHVGESVIIFYNCLCYCC